MTARAQVVELPKGRGASVRLLRFMEALLQLPALQSLLIEPTGIRVAREGLPENEPVVPLTLVEQLNNEATFDADLTLVLANAPVAWLETLPNSTALQHLFMAFAVIEDLNLRVAGVLLPVGGLQALLGGAKREHLSGVPYLEDAGIEPNTCVVIGSETGHLLDARTGVIFSTEAS